MNLPVQAAPVSRGYIRVQQSAALVQQACKIFKCGAKIIACAGACLPNPLNPGCIGCLGSAWDDCKGCFGVD